MAKSKFILHDTIKSLKKKLKEKEYSDIRDHLRAVILIAKGQTYPTIADILGYSVQWVKKLSIDYTREGLDGIKQKPRKGSKGFLSPDQVIELYGIILEGPDEDDLLSRYRISDLQKIVKNKWDVEYSVSGMHALLQRMQLSHVTTRPQNPKNDPAIMELWKKKSKILSTRKRKSTAVLKSGSKMKPDSVKRASVTESGL